MSRMRRFAIAVSTISLLSLGTALTAASAAPAGGVKGDPQPELIPFKIGAASSPGSVAIEPNGSIVTAYDISSAKLAVCVLARGGHKCSHKTTITTHGNANTLFGTPQVFAPSANHVVVLQNTTEFDYLYTSTDGGASFGAPVQVGTASALGVTAAALISGKIVFGTGDDNSGAQAESIAVSAGAPPSSIATATTKAASDYGVGSYKGGALVASDFLGTNYTTYVAYAPSGKNFNSSASYHRVGSFSHEQLIGISGDALLTMSATGKQSLELRLFNGNELRAGARRAGPQRWRARVVRDRSGPERTGARLQLVDALLEDLRADRALDLQRLRLERRSGSRERDAKHHLCRSARLPWYRLGPGHGPSRGGIPSSAPSGCRSA